MGTAPPSLLVSVDDHAALVKVLGRASFTCGVPFKRLVHELRERGYQRFVLDLTGCVTMDSTFLGILAGLVLPVPEPQAAPAAVSISLLNPCPRVSELLDNLGIVHLFQVQHGPPLSGSGFDAVSSEKTPDRRQMTETSLEAHEALMAAHPDNVARFKDVAQFLAEDLKKIGKTQPEG